MTDTMKFQVQELRPEVTAFALLMEARLREKDADKGQRWKDKTEIDHIVDICTASRRIVQDLFPFKEERSVKALVDMANRCMMLADVLGELEQPEEPQPAQETYVIPAFLRKQEG